MVVQLGEPLVGQMVASKAVQKAELRVALKVAEMARLKDAATAGKLVVNLADPLVCLKVATRASRMVEYLVGMMA